MARMTSMGRKSTTLHVSTKLWILLQERFILQHAGKLFVKQHLLRRGDMLAARNT
jgi:hypothetical protein